MDLYGYTFTDVPTNEDTTGIEFLANSSIVNGVINDDYHDFYIYSTESNVLINNLELNTQVDDSDNYIAGITADGGNMVIKNSKFETAQFLSNESNLTIVNVDAVGVIVSYENGTIELNDSYFYNEKTYMVYIYSTGFLEVNNSTIFSDSPGCYINSSGDYYAESMGIMNEGTLIFNSGYVFGTHSAIEAEYGSKTYVYGGTFESTDHGGFYFNHGPSGIAYIENANIGGIDYPAEGKLRPNGKVNSLEYDGVTYNLEEVKVAFYSGGTTAQNGESTYIVNSNIYAKGTEFIVIRSSTPQQNVYFSGTKFLNTKANQYIRLQNFNTMRLYLGSGNSYGLIDKVYNNGTTVPFDTARANGAIIDTHISYKDIVRPE